jgi:hypothetical protein
MEDHSMMVKKGVAELLPYQRAVKDLRGLLSLIVCLAS